MRFRPLLTTLVWLVGMCSVAPGELLYDAGLGTTPNQQGWAYLTNPFVGAEATQVVQQGVLALDTRPVIGEQAGYFYSAATIDLAATAFTLAFLMQQVDGVDVPDSDPLAIGERNRGGLSVIVISQDLRGIELQFQTDHILALDDRNTAFPIGESVAFDTTSSLQHYQLMLTTTAYQLLANQQPILHGPLRDYGPIAPPGPAGLVYTAPNLLFLGDNTGRGAALTRLSQISLFTVPEPGQAVGLAVGWAAWGAWGLRRRRSGHRRWSSWYNVNIRQRLA